MKTKRKTPDIRFRGFSDDWEQRKLGELVTISSGQSPSLFEDGEEPYLKVDDLNNSFKVQTSSKMTVKKNTRFEMVNVNSVIFPKRGAAIMTNKVRIMGMSSYMDTNLMALEPVNIYPEFLYTLISKIGLYRIADTSTIPQINNKHIEPYRILLPDDYEQQYIGDIFSLIDKTITLHQRKLQQLKEVKRGMLLKIIPNDNKKDLIRFIGFKKILKSAEFGEILTSHGTKKYIDGSSTTGKYPIIQQGDISVINYSNKSPFQEYEQVSIFGDHTLSLYKPNKPFLVASDGVKILSSKLLEGYYLYYLIERFMPESQGYKRHYTILKNIDILYTEVIEEQKFIGSLFEKLDRMIELQEREIELLVETKKGFLQKMFV